MDKRITVEDRLEILEMLARYNWAIDCDDADAFAETFAEDGEFVTPARVWKGRDEMRELVAYLHGKRDGDAQRSLFHYTHNVVLEHLDDDHVRFIAQMIGPRCNNEGVWTLQLGWYDDVVTRTTEGWRWGKRHFHQPWPEVAPSSSPVRFPVGS